MTGLAHDHHSSEPDSRRGKDTLVTLHANNRDLVTIHVPGVASPITFARTAQEGGFWELFAGNKWEPENISLIVKQMGPGRTFVDVGAWIGPLSLIAAKCGARVVAVEPDPVALHLLRLNLDLNPDVDGRVTVVPKALSAKHGHASLSSTRLGDSMASLVRKGAETTSVDTVDAEFWSKTLDFASADMLKIDIEGAEFSVLPRLSRAFRDRRPVLLLWVDGYHFRERLARSRRRSWIHHFLSLILPRPIVPGNAFVLLSLAMGRRGFRLAVPSVRRRIRFLFSLQEAELVMSD